MNMSMSFFLRGGVVLVVSGLAFLSCRKWLQVTPPENQMSASGVFRDDANAENAVIGLYSHMMNNSRGLFNGGMSLYGGMSSDDVGCIGRIASEYAFLQDTLSAGNPLCAGLYDSAYNLIFIANSLLGGLKQTKGVSAATRAQLTGEAEFVRAHIYFYLVNLYGAVPMVLSMDYVQTALLPRMPANSVYARIKTDLLDAQANLSLDYPEAGASDKVRTRPNRAAATALLARVYLYTADWMRADSAATAVLNDPAYRLEANLDSVFQSGSRETIWALQPVYGNIATAEGNFFIPPTVNALPTYPLTNILLNSFEPMDQRRVHWTAKGANGQSYGYKYKQRLNIPPNGEFNVVLRLAEMVLIRAEARAMQGNADAALADVNVLRQRAGLPLLAAPMSNADLLTAIRHERQTEFFAEWGHRWLDLKRTGQANAILGAEKPRWVGTDTLYPLPAGELTNNPNLVQNPGY